MTKLLKVDFRERITAKEILDHPFLREPRKTVKDQLKFIDFIDQQKINESNSSIFIRKHSQPNTIPIYNENKS